MTEGPEGAVAKTQIVVSLNMSNLKAIQEAWALNEVRRHHTVSRGAFTMCQRGRARRAERRVGRKGSGGGSARWG